MNKNCDVCLREKKTSEEIFLSEHVANDVIELIHCDLWGHYKTASSCSAFYFVTIMDDYSRVAWIHLIGDKREVLQTLVDIFPLIKTQFDKPLNIL